MEDSALLRNADVMAVIEPPSSHDEDVVAKVQNRAIDQPFTHRDFSPPHLARELAHRQPLIVQRFAPLTFASA